MSHSYSPTQITVPLLLVLLSHSYCPTPISTVPLLLLSHSYFCPTPTVPLLLVLSHSYCPTLTVPLLLVLSHSYCPTPIVPLLLVLSWHREVYHTAPWADTIGLYGPTPYELWALCKIMSYTLQSRYVTYTIVQENFLHLTVESCRLGPLCRKIFCTSLKN